ncbi:MAG: ribosomal L7Ae/L30e/S12e/Gadd45 family protein [Clostridia bacterium]|nr:ribosomal L7Ae/L30e/S12e/Gadd45 family protein [Clostridia bacterium]
MLDTLKMSAKTVGMRTTIRAIESGAAYHAFIAEDADVFITRRVQELCQAKDIPYTRVESMKMLGEACGVQVGAACAALVKHAG